MTLVQKRQFLAKVIKKEENSLRDRLRALEIDAKLAGELGDRFDVTVSAHPPLTAEDRAARLLALDSPGN